MARGSWNTFELFGREAADGTHNLNTSTFACAFLSNAYDSIAVSATAHSLTDFTEVAGGTYAAKNLINRTWTRAGAISTLNADDFTGAQEWARDQTNGPTDIRTLIVYNIANQVALGVMDLTADGTTPVSLQAGPISVTWNANGILRHTVTA